VRSYVRDYGLMRVGGNNLKCRVLSLLPVEIAARIVTIHLRTAPPGKTSNCSDAGPDIAEVGPRRTTTELSPNLGDGRDSGLCLRRIGPLAFYDFPADHGRPDVHQ
jgi:hypothetical protein